MRILESIRSFVAEQSGASMVEYGVALIVVVAIGVVAMNGLGGKVKSNVETSCSVINNGLSNPCI